MRRPIISAWAVATVLVIGAACFGVAAAAGQAGEPTRADTRGAGAAAEQKFKALPVVDSVAEAERRTADEGFDDDALKVITHELAFQYVDLPPQGDSMGDFFWSTGSLYNASHRKVIGQQILKCEFTDIGSWCEQPLRFNGRGKILLSNPILNGDGTVAVTGGTGEFREARGQAKLFVLDNGHTFDILFVIDIDD
jgi:hypothetical protein